MDISLIRNKQEKIKVKKKVDNPYHKDYFIHNEEIDAYIYPEKPSTTI